MCCSPARRAWGRRRWRRSSPPSSTCRSSDGGPALERKGDVAAFLTALEPRSVFFVDEIHRLPRALEETFYPAMEDGRLPITVGQGAGARVVTLDLPPFTLVGATTRAGLLTTPLRDRFGIQHRLDAYDVADLAAIVRRSARSSRSSSTTTAPRRSPLAPAARPASRTACSSASATTPRSAPTAWSPRRSPTRRSRSSRSTTSAWTASTATSSAPSARSSPGPVGLSTLAVTVGEEQDTIEDVYEPYLLQCGLLKRTARGRVQPRTPSPTSASSRRPRPRSCSRAARP